MGSRAITRDLYDTMIIAARREATPRAMSLAVGIRHETAVRALTLGWPAKGFAPINDVLREEHEKLRAMAEERAAGRREAMSDHERKRALEEANEDARVRRMATRDGLKVRAQELELARGCRDAVALGQSIVRRALASVREYIFGDAANGHAPHPLDWSKGDVLDAVRKLLAMQADLARAASEVTVIERRIAGEPVDIIGVELNDVTVAEVSERQRWRSAILDAMRQASGKAGGAPALPPGDPTSRPPTN